VRCQHPARSRPGGCRSASVEPGLRPARACDPGGTRRGDGQERLSTPSWNWSPELRMHREGAHRAGDQEGGASQQRAAQLLGISRYRLRRRPKRHVLPWCKSEHARGGFRGFVARLTSGPGSTETSLPQSRLNLGSFVNLPTPNVHLERPAWLPLDPPWASGLRALPSPERPSVSN
jgi:hypothetical protein